MSKETVLVIEDEPQISKLLTIVLESNGYKVASASTGQEGIVQAANHPPDLILLDLGLPDKNGHEVLKILRGWFQKGIIILTVQQGEEDIVNALDNGASDYITKPFRTGELLARIRSVIRRYTLETHQPVAQFGNLEIDFVNRVVKRNGVYIKLTQTEYNLLALLARNEGKVLTHHYLLKEVWGVAFQSETQYLRVFIAQLRKKLEDNPDQPQHILTESGIGYRFT